MIIYTFRYTHTYIHIYVVLLTERTFDMAEKSNKPDALEVSPDLCFSESEKEPGRKKVRQGRKIFCSMHFVSLYVMATPRSLAFPQCACVRERETINNKGDEIISTRENIY